MNYSFSLSLLRACEIRTLGAILIFLSNSKSSNELSQSTTPPAPPQIREIEIYNIMNVNPLENEHSLFYIRPLGWDLGVIQSYF